jgi:NADH-quinone oxidoreductase subunit E
MLSQNALALINTEIAKYPAGKQRSAVLAALRIAQTELECLTADIINFIADYLQLPPTQVMEVATFYSMYDLAAVGKYKLSICTNLPCLLRGAADSIEHLEQKLSIKVGQTTADGRFTLKACECFGACGEAPVLLVNNHVMYTFMHAEELDKKLATML